MSRLYVSFPGAVVSSQPGAEGRKQSWQKPLSSTGTTIFRARPSMPPGLVDVTRHPELVTELLRRGCTDEEAKKVAGGDLLRVSGKRSASREELRKERDPSFSVSRPIRARRTAQNSREIPLTSPFFVRSIISISFN